MGPSVSMVHSQKRKLGVRFGKTPDLLRDFFCETFPNAMININVNIKININVNIKININGDVNLTLLLMLALLKSGGFPQISKLLSFDRLQLEGTAGFIGFIFFFGSRIFQQSPDVPVTCKKRE